MARIEDRIMESFTSKGLGISDLTSRAIQQANLPSLAASISESIATRKAEGSERTGDIASALSKSRLSELTKKLTGGGSGVLVAQKSRRGNSPSITSPRIAVGKPKREGILTRSAKDFPGLAKIDGVPSSEESKHLNIQGMLDKAQKVGLKAIKPVGVTKPLISQDNVTTDLPSTLKDIVEKARDKRFINTSLGTGVRI